MNKFKELIISNRKLIVALIAIIFVLIVIYFFSSMDYFKTNYTSKNFIKYIVKNLYKTENEYELSQFVSRVNTGVRKLAHLFLFCMLGIFINIIMKSRYKLEHRYNVIVICICFICGILDEFHQSFVPGRSCKFTDVLIDTLGATIGVVVVNIFYKKIKPKVFRLNEKCNIERGTE